MKTTKIQTVDTAICDYCGADSTYPYKCFGCGKDACNQCWLKLVRYEAPRPLMLETGSDSFGTGIFLSNAYFCEDCDKSPENKVSPLLKDLEAKRQSLIKAYKEYRRVVDPLTRKANALISNLPHRQ